MSVASVIHFRRLLNHRALWYRDVSTTQDEFNDPMPEWEELETPEGNSAGLNARPHQQTAGSLHDHGPGEQQVAERTWFLDKGFLGIGDRDVLSVVSGVESPVLLRVLGAVPQWDYGQLHHIEVRAEVWEGSLDDEEES